MHVASPFFFEGTYEYFVLPAVNGTTAVMKACQAAGVKRCVVTSSVAAVMCPAAADRPADGVFNETHWTNNDRPEGVTNYFKSKTLAEKAAWDFVAELPDDQKFELVTINPAFVMGPPMRKEPFQSGQWLQSLMEGKMEKISADRFCVVDVRDVAFAHIAAIKVQAAAGRRFLLVHSSPSF